MSAFFLDIGEVKAGFRHDLGRDAAVCDRTLQIEACKAQGLL